MGASHLQQVLLNSSRIPSARRLGCGAQSTHPEKFSLSVNRASARQDRQRGGRFEAPLTTHCLLFALRKGHSSRDKRLENCIHSRAELAGRRCRFDPAPIPGQFAPFWTSSSREGDSLQNSRRLDRVMIHAACVGGAPSPSSRVRLWRRRVGRGTRRGPARAIRRQNSEPGRVDLMSPNRARNAI